MSHFLLGLLKKIHVHFWVYISQSDEDLCVNVEDSWSTSEEEETSTYKQIELAYWCKIMH